MKCRYYGEMQEQTFFYEELTNERLLEKKLDHIVSEKVAREHEEREEETPKILCERSYRYVFNL